MGHHIRQTGRSVRRPLHAALTAAVLGGLLGGAPVARAADAPARTRVIVELDGATALEAPAGAARDARTADVRAARERIDARQDTVLDAAKDAGAAPKSVRHLGLALNAVAMTVDEDSVTRLRALPGVKAVVPDTRMKVLATDAHELVGIPDVWKRPAPGGGTVTGKGVIVAVVDSGVDYTHPDLGAGLGEGHKVVGGHDFVNDDDDPMDDNAHGTHVAGIIAAKSAAPGGITGAAPDARLLAYKVMDADGYGETSAIIAGIEAAIDPANPHRADVINLSIGGPGDGTDPLGLAATAAVDAGVVVVAAAGNEGPGPYTVGSPAAARGVLAVGASTSGIAVPELRLAGQRETLETYRGLVSANPPEKPSTGALVDIGTGTPEDWERAGDVRGKVVLYAFPPARGEDESLYPEDLAAYAEAEKRGALALIGGASGGGGPVLAGGRAARTVPVEQPGDGAPVPADSGRRLAGTDGDLRMDHLVVTGVDRIQGQELTELAARGAELTLSGRDSSDEIAAFSSRGPDQNLGLKPDLVAPGVEIRSTVPRSMVGSGAWRMSGTSMASPLVAGSAALLRQLQPDRSATEIGAELTGTAHRLKGVDTIAQGAGRLDVAAVADAVLTASPATVSLGLADMGGPRVTAGRTVTFHNSSARTVSGAVSVDGGAARVSPRRITVRPGGTATVKLTLDAPRPDTTVHVSGAIGVTDHGRALLSVPYLLEAAPLYVDATPDPSSGASTAYVYTPTALTAPPVLTVDPPKGPTYTRPTRPTADPHYFATDLAGSTSGTYRLTARATATGGQRQYGAGGFEVTPQDARGAKWQPVGPNSADGRVTLAPGAPHQAVMTQYGKPGAWLTTDSGKTWTERGRTPFMGAATNEPSLIVDAHDPDRWWSAMIAVSWSVGAGGILRTDDRGRTWERLNAPDDSYRDLVSDADTRVLVARSDNGLLISRDGGDSWRNEDLGLPADVLKIAMGGDDLYAWVGREVWVVRGMTGDGPKKAERVYAVASDRSQVIAGFGADGPLVAVQVLGKAGGLFTSADGGRSWRTGRSDGRGLVTVTRGEILLDGSDGTTRVSKDAGATWQEIGKPNPATVVYDYDRWADGSYTVSAASAGIYRGAQGSSGQHRIGVQGESVPALAVAGKELLAGTGVGMYRTALPVTSPEWGAGEHEGTTGTQVSAIRTYARDSSIVWRTFESLAGLAVQKSTDGGRTWEDRGQLDGNALSLLVDPRDPDRVAVSYARIDGPGVYTTTDGGGHWKSLRKDDQFRALTADPHRNGRIWLGGYGGLYYSDDFGRTVTKAAEGEVSALGTDGSRLIVGGTTLRWSSDGGRTFHTADHGGLRIQVSGVVEAGGDLYAGTTGRWVPGEVPYGARGVLRSTDGGRTWRNVSGTLQNLDVLSMAAAPDGRSLYVGTALGGVHRLKLK
ncbi:S8 family serine peptidase [Streptomyces sp. NPDC059759]|uniref:S8 family serine peptidase n=1 Tax=Streptomyces sp. NPDC059759 TaxID=3346936 RepID=UPI003648F3F4